ncbi:pilus assembly protein TadG-related protein [Bordetella genomosp. 13]|uniref:pilus assembly protein TadG-related protein n=1 Tax=Bordetella genomosp. 13 TaxID=463040 RepID=UPI0011A8BD06|nr:pilus assembly protein TadG-related protein [Bordetella genomosp. 13]
MRARARACAPGQALVPAVALLGLCAVAWVGLYNVGQTASARTRLTHAADAAAYSAALAQARTLNMLAYVNRAQIAHQVAMAHLVTLASWAQFSGTQAQRRAMGNPPAYLIGSLFGAKALQGYAAAQATSGMAAQFARSHAEHDALVHDTLAQVARRQVDQLPAQRGAMLRAVLRANYPELDASSSAPQWRLLDDGLPGFVRAEHAGESSSLARMVRTAAARYDFLRPRDITRRNAWMVYRSCPERRHELRRRGDTQMDARGRWSANDTLSYHALRENHWIGCHYREYAMGWGLAGRDDGTPVVRAPEDFSQEDFWRWVDQNTSWDIIMGVTNPLASAYGAAARVPVSGRGLADYHEVSQARADTPLRLAVAVRQQGESLPTTEGNGHVAVAGRFGWHALAGGGLTVTSAAETFFSRPQPRVDGRDELATLFRPYWQARRVAVTDAEAAAARRLP